MMRGSRRIGLLAISVVCVFAFTAVSAFADADDELLTQGVGGVLLRDISTVSTNQPTAIELVNTETTKLEIPGVSTSECTEGEFGAYVTKNKANPELSVPLGVFENCIATGGLGNAPVYVDTEGAKKAASGIEAVIFDEGAPPIKAELKGLKLSIYIFNPVTKVETTCKYTGTITGVWTNGAGPFTEEASNNQSMVDLSGQKLTSTTCPTATITSGKFFVETTSDGKNVAGAAFPGNSDTVFVKT